MIVIILFYYDLRIMNCDYYGDTRNGVVVGWVDYGRLVPEPSMGVIIIGLKIPFLCLCELLLYEATWESL